MERKFTLEISCAHVWTKLLFRVDCKVYTSTLIGQAVVVLTETTDFLHYGAIATKHKDKVARRQAINIGPEKLEAKILPEICATEALKPPVLELQRHKKKKVKVL